MEDMMANLIWWIIFEKIEVIVEKGIGIKIERGEKAEVGQGNVIGSGEEEVALEIEKAEKMTTAADENHHYIGMYLHQDLNI